ncbi:MAG: hypothetical protein ACKOYH_05985 [Cyanobium sp.]
MGAALWDEAAQRVASAKNPLPWVALLEYRASYLAEPVPAAPLPPVRVEEQGAAARGCPKGRKLAPFAPERPVGAGLCRDRIRWFVHQMSIFCGNKMDCGDRVGGLRVHAEAANVLP